MGKRAYSLGIPLASLVRLYSPQIRRIGEVPVGFSKREGLLPSVWCNILRWPLFAQSLPPLGAPLVVALSLVLDLLVVAKQPGCV